LKSKLPSSAWGYAALIKIRPTSYHTYSPAQLVQGKEPNISHFRTFGYAIYVSIAPSHRTKMGPQRRLGVYVSFESPSIIKYLVPLTGDLFTARFADCHFDEAVFPTLGKELNRQQEKQISEVSWSVPSLTHYDPHTSQIELDV
jgi:hypothetical protein